MGRNLYTDENAFPTRQQFHENRLVGIAAYFRSRGIHGNSTSVFHRPQTKMKPSQKITLGVSMALLVAALLYAWGSRDHYEYHTGLDGAAMWRCNKSSGVVEFCTLRGGPWQRVKDATSFNAPETLTFEEATKAR